MDNNTEQSIILFYGMWQMAVCFFAFIALYGIWYHIGRKQKDWTSDYTQRGEG